MKKLFPGTLILQMLTCEFVLGMPRLTFLLTQSQVLCLSMLSVLAFVWGLRILDNNGCKFWTKQTSAQGRLMDHSKAYLCK